jgi:hypothetical protein
MRYSWLGRLLLPSQASALEFEVDLANFNVQHFNISLGNVIIQDLIRIFEGILVGGAGDYVYEFALCSCCCVDF